MVPLDGQRSGSFGAVIFKSKGFPWAEPLLQTEQFFICLVWIPGFCQRFHFRRVLRGPASLKTTGPEGLAHPWLPPWVLVQCLGPTSETVSSLWQPLRYLKTVLGLCPPSLPLTPPQAFSLPKPNTSDFFSHCSDPG